MLNWLRRLPKARPPLPPPLQAAVDAVSGHVMGQISAFENKPTECVPERGRMNDLLIGAYVWGLLDGYIHRSNADAEWDGDRSAEAAVLAAGDEIFSRLFGQERAQWLRGNLPQWGAPWPEHPSFRWALAEMHNRGASDSNSLASDDPLSFARAGGLLGFLMLMARPLE